MKSLIFLVMLLLLPGCKEGDSPTAPTNKPATPVRTNGVAGYVYSASGACLDGAVVEVIDGVRAGISATQAGCGSPWDDVGQGYYFELPADMNVRLRASMKGYQLQEKTLLVNGTAGPEKNFVLIPE